MLILASGIHLGWPQMGTYLSSALAIKFVTTRPIALSYCLGLYIEGVHLMKQD